MAKHRLRLHELTKGITTGFAESSIKAEVSYLGAEFRGEKDIRGSQFTVVRFHALEVVHSIQNLTLKRKSRQYKHKFVKSSYLLFVYGLEYTNFVNNVFQIITKATSL